MLNTPYSCVCVTLPLEPQGIVTHPGSMQMKLGSVPTSKPTFVSGKPITSGPNPTSSASLTVGTSSGLTRRTATRKRTASAPTRVGRDKVRKVTEEGTVRSSSVQRN